MYDPPRMRLSSTSISARTESSRLLETLTLLLGGLEPMLRGLEEVEVSISITSTPETPSASPIFTSRESKSSGIPDVQLYGGD